MRAKKPRTHVTLSEGLLTQLEELAKRTGASVSAVIEGLVTEALEGDEGSAAGMRRELTAIRQGVDALQAQVLPLVETVNRLLREAGHTDQPSPPEPPEPRPKIATYEEMYGPIERAPQPDSPPAPVTPPPPAPRRSWWRS
jgi:hypothetical protein